MLNASSLGSKVGLQALLWKTWRCRVSFLCNLSPFGPMTPPFLLHGSTIDKEKRRKSSHHQVGGTVIRALHCEGGFELPPTLKAIGIYILCRGSDDLVIILKVLIPATSLNSVPRSWVSLLSSFRSPRICRISKKSPWLFLRTALCISPLQLLPVRESCWNHCNCFLSEVSRSQMSAHQGRANFSTVLSVKLWCL